jgi:hypothetical protein
MYEYQMAVIFSNSIKICQHFPFQGPTNFSQIYIFGLKTYHLATPNGIQYNADTLQNFKL